MTKSLHILIQNIVLNVILCKYLKLKLYKCVLPIWISITIYVNIAASHSV